MITTSTPLRRVAVTLAITGVAAFGAVAIAPAAFADDTTVVTDQAAAASTAPEAVVPDTSAVPPVVIPPVVIPPAVVIGKDGKPVKESKVCKDSDQKEFAEKLAEALAGMSDSAASKLEAQAPSIVAKVGGIGCIVVAVPGGRF